MATIERIGSIDATQLSVTPTVNVSGGAATGTINAVRAHVRFSTTAYSKSYTVAVTLYYAGGEAVAHIACNFSELTADGYTFEANFGALTLEQANSIYAVAAYTSENGSTIFLKGEQKVLIDYTPVTSTKCGAPSSVYFSKTIARDPVTLYWEGATDGGADNAIVAYDIQICESWDGGATWGGWGVVDTVINYATYGSIMVTPPATAGNYYKCRVRTRGAAGEAYFSDWRETSNTLRKDHDPLDGFTDDPLAVDVTPVKALHMQELQARVATLRAFYGLPAYAFTTITAGETSLAGWTAHVMEIRAAVDEIGKAHENWLAITENKPRADVMQQLREVVLAI